MKSQLIYGLLLLIISGCATKQLHVHKDIKTTSVVESQIEHSFFLIGNTAGDTDVLNHLEQEIQSTNDNSTVLFLGNNSNNTKDLKNETLLETQLNALKNYNGQTIFIPGSYEWSKGVKSLKNYQKEVQKKLNKQSFAPKNGCPIKDLKIGDDITLIIIDSQWYISNWDNHPTINDNCDIKTRADFLNEFGSLVKKSRGRTTIVALYHPLYTNGTYGGQYSFGSHMSPLPILGTIKNVIRKTSGIHAGDLQYKRYRELKNRISTLAQENKKVVLVSGHEHNLQYLIEDNIPQIISGSGSKITSTRKIGNSQFAYASQGFARLDVYKDGSSQVQFYTSEDQKTVFETEVFPPTSIKTPTTYQNSFPQQKTASIYTAEETDKSGMHTFLWGDRYRKYYSTKVQAPVVTLDTLLGGLTPIRKGGGNQSKSLRLKDKNGAQYVMRALRKNAVQYLQATVFKDQNIKGQFDNTDTEDLILDAFTGAHPYAPFAVGTLADAIDVFHTNPILFYVPKHNALGNFNDDFGDELYMIEEHTSAGHSELASFGYQDKIISTDEMMKKIHQDEDIVIDEASYIRARLFDMLIGDWDRHQDQWRWIEFKENGKRVFRPLPRDRDQAFSIMSDGFLLSAAVTLVPTARLLRSYSEDLTDVKGINVEPYPIDMELINESDKSIWNDQVKQIQEGITDEVIEQAFANIPKEVRDETIDEIKRLLKARRTNMQKIADRYYDVVNKFSVIKGTNKDDWFDIERLSDGKTKVTAYRIKNGDKSDVFHERIYHNQETKEIWIYGLDDDDVFHVYGNEKSKIKLRLIGGQNKDTYDIKNGHRVKFYDYKTKKSNILTSKGKKRLTDQYATNVYNYKKLKNNTNQLIPTIGANPDDGLKIGASNTYTNYGFERNPFTSRHTVSGAYFFANEGYELDYKGEFANVIGSINVGVDAHFNSPNYSVNFFGFGNSTPNFEPDDDDGQDVDLDFNRVRIRTFRISPSLIWKGQLGARFKLSPFYESNEVERTQGRFLEDLFAQDNVVFDMQDFYGLEAMYHFENRDNEAFPTLGFEISLRTGYKNNVDTEKGYGYIVPELGIDYKLVPSGQLVVATKLRGNVNIGDDFEFYQGATLGANTGLRGYRNERFTGKSAFVQSTDLRWNFSNLKTGVLPIHIGIFGGIDYGRVWVDDELVEETAFNSNDWNTSIGGGFFMNMANIITANISAFNSDDNLRLAFKLGFGF